MFGDLLQALFLLCFTVLLISARVYASLYPCESTHASCGRWSQHESAGYVEWILEFVGKFLPKGGVLENVDLLKYADDRDLSSAFDLLVGGLRAHGYAVGWRESDLLSFHKMRRNRTAQAFLFTLYASIFVHVGLPVKS